MSRRIAWSRPLVTISPSIVGFAPPPMESRTKTPDRSGTEREDRTGEVPKDVAWMGAWVVPVPSVLSLAADGRSGRPAREAPRLPEPEPGSRSR